MDFDDLFGFSEEERRAIVAGLAREPEWKRQRIMGSSDNFAAWLRSNFPELWSRLTGKPWWLR